MGGKVITDPTEYHRLRIREALGFDQSVGALGLLDAMETNIRGRHPNPSPLIAGIVSLRTALHEVRNLCADGDEVP